MFDRLKECRYRRKVSLIVLSICFGCINVAGLCMYWLDCLPMFSSIVWFIGGVMLAIGFAGIFYLIACFLFQIFDRGSYIIKGKEQFVLRFEKWIQNHFFIFCFIVILLAWLPWIISYYPASMNDDVFGQLYAWFCEPSNHHPWFATTILAACYNIGSGLRNDNLGIFTYIIIRDVILALIYAKCVMMQKEVGFKKIFYYGTLAFYAITPVWGAYAKHAFKDTFCAGLFCLYIITLIMVIRQIEKKTLTFQICLMYGMAALIVSLFRHNCIYAVLPTTLVLVVVLLVRKQPVRCVSIIVLCITVYFGYNYYIIHYAGVAPGAVTEALAIPLQQTARLVRDHGEELEPEAKEAIGGVFQYDKLAEEYDPILSDPIKWNCQIPTDMKNPGANVNWLKTWAKMLFQYPVTYFEAAIGQSYGYYAFTPDILEGSGKWYSGMAIYSGLGFSAGDYDENFDFHYMDGMNELRQMLDVWAKAWDKIPVLRLTDSCALYTWSIVLIFYYLFIKKRYFYLIPFIAVVLMILTCIASPVNDTFRYFAPVAASFPALVVLLKETEKTIV